MSCKRIAYNRFKLSVVTSLALALSGTSPSYAATTKSEQVVIGQSARTFNPGLANMWIGTQIGLYGPDLTAKTVGTSGATENLQLTLSGAVTLSAGTQDVALAAMGNGQMLPVISPCIYLRGMVQRVAVLNVSPIKSFADLKGKKVGSPSVSSTQVPYLKYAVKAAGVDPDDVQIIGVGSDQQAAAAITSKQVDAYVATDVQIASMQAAGIPLRILDQPDSIKDAAVAYAFVFQRSWYEGHKKQAAEMLQGMIKSIIVMLVNPEAAVRISFLMHPESIPTGVPFDIALKNAIAATKIRAAAVSKTAMGYKRWCEFSKDAWTKYIAMLGLTGKVNPSDFYTDELVNQVNDFDEVKFTEWARHLKVPDSFSEYQSWAASLKPPQ